MRQHIWDCLDRGTRTGYDALIPRTCSRPDSELIFLLVNGSEQISEQKIRARLISDAQLDETLVDPRVSIEPATSYMAVQDAEDRQILPVICRELERLIENRMRQ